MGTRQPSEHGTLGKPVSKGPGGLQGSREWDEGQEDRTQRGRAWSAGSPCVPLEKKWVLEGMHFSSSLWMLSREGWQQGGSWESPGASVLTLG